jgi:PAS domain S-box-containing protein
VRAAERSLHASEQLLRQLIQHTPAAVAMFDTELRYLQVSDRWLTAYGLSGSEVLGRSLYDVFRVFPSAGGSSTSALSPAQCSAVTRTRSRVPTAPSTGSSGRYSRGAAPKGKSAASSCSDHLITERKRAEEALRASEDRFRSAMESSAIGLAIVAPDGRWLEVNPALCAIVGYTREELLATTFQAITHPDDLTVDVGAQRSLLNREIDHYTSEKRYLDKQGRERWVQLNVSLSCDADGTPRHFFTQVQDIGARKRPSSRSSSFSTPRSSTPSAASPGESRTTSTTSSPSSSASSSWQASSSAATSTSASTSARRAKRA